MSQVNIPSSQHAGDVAPRVPISLRLPPQIISAVDTFAADNRMTKTDAFMFFVQKGMDASAAEPREQKLDAIDRRLERIEELLRVKEGA